METDGMSFDVNEKITANRDLVTTQYPAIQFYIIAGLDESI
jgi:hypothetical protein